MWTAEITVEFVPLPPEKEAAYWAAMKYFADLMYGYMLEELIDSSIDHNEAQK
jgi:hypothetical protein